MHNIHLNISHRAEALEMHQDETKFRRIFGNLVRNALYHRKERIDVSLTQDDDRLRLDVTDDGPGVRPEHREIIFGRYKQADVCSMPNRPGHGLGLAGSLILARCLGGDIELMSQKGKGATFRLTLPSSLENASHTKESLYEQSS
jgi:two-component system OmpR family sensor kinase